MAEQPQWTHTELAGILEMSVISDLERLIADPGRKHRYEFANSYAINALQNLADAEVLHNDIRVLVQRILALHKTASDPFLGMNLPQVGIETVDAEEQARQDWSNDE
jgi:hypothetical protein